MMRNLARGREETDEEARAGRMSDRNRKSMPEERKKRDLEEKKKRGIDLPKTG